MSADQRISDPPLGKLRRDTFIGRLKTAGITFILVAPAITLGILQYGHLKWAYVFTCALGFAVHLCWGKRQRRWFWPAVFFLVVAHAVALACISTDALSTDLGKGTMAIWLADAVLDGVFLWWMGWLFDPHEKPRTSASLIVEIILYGFVVVVAGIIATIVWAVDRADDQVARLSRMVLERPSTQSVYQLEQCLGPGVFNNPHAWPELRSGAHGSEMYNSITDLGVSA